jgi:hypothetical protein
VTRLRWADIDKKYVNAGLDRGVLYPKVGDAVPWDGLISVEENGADTSTVYYVDGRPFLILPKPKEFSATLRAYMYPDEFSAMMGTVEATDGMFLDSQMGDIFDLSYRTLLGDAINGFDGDYKIHLIYNATVAAPGVTYETMSDSLSPTDFSWQIQAVPVSVPGFRATAHISIDTRNIDAKKLLMLEALLYGTGNTDAHLPSPTTILDMLSYGDTIIITDNGDGTWTAEGSRDNIYMIGDNIFQIDNVDAVDNGDGTYTISSTAV